MDGCENVVVARGHCRRHGTVGLYGAAGRKDGVNARGVCKRNRASPSFREGGETEERKEGEGLSKEEIDKFVESLFVWP